MVMPAIKFIVLLWAESQPMIFSLHCADIIDNISKGVPRPMPKNKKFRILEAGLFISNALAKKTAMNAGLHGRTIAPKKKPNPKALFIGFPLTGEVILGKNLPKSKLNIKKTLIIPNITNAIGETIPMTPVKDCCKMVVNKIPSNSMNEITPRTTINPNNIMDFLSSFPENWLER